MASMMKRDGRTVMQWHDAEGRRRTLSLGKPTAKQAAALKIKIEALITASLTGTAVEDDVAVWVATKLPRRLAEKLAAVDLIPRRETAMLTEFIDAYLDQRSDLKPNTMIVMRQSRIWLVRFLGEDRRMDRVTVADADAYKAHMIGSGLARATIAKRCRYARHFFEVAKRRGIVRVNPFAHIKGAVTGNVERRVFVPGELVAKVMAVAPDPQWKLLIALGRWGGLRMPSEALTLTWADVDFAEKRFIIRSSKTAHHADGGIRVVPMFPELVQHFQAVFDAAPEGSLHVITRYRRSNVNLRTQLLRYIEDAGIKAWPKAWQNLRASRATELADIFPSHVCAAWLGHTEKIADAFYRTVTDEHYRKATDESAAIALHHPAAGGSTEPQEPEEVVENAKKSGKKLVDAITCDKNLGEAGIEPARPVRDRGF